MEGISDLWYIKLVISVFVLIFAPIHVSFSILMVLVLIDTGTGIAHAVKIKRFNVKYLGRAANKLITYGVCIITTRLLEQGIIYFYETTVVSQAVIGYLIAAEAISIFQNLALMGAPIPGNFVNAFLKSLRVPGLEDVVRHGLDEYSEINEVREIISYQVPTFRNNTMRKLLEIKYESWTEVFIFIRKSIAEENPPGKDILYYKVMSVIETTYKEVREKWNELGIPKECIEKFDEWHEPRVDVFIKHIKDICYSDISLKEKKQQMTDRLLALLYQTILDAHKSEADLMACKECGCSRSSLDE